MVFKLANAAPKDRQVSIRMTTADYETIKRGAALYGMSIGDFMVAIAADEARKEEAHHAKTK